MNSKLISNQSNFVINIESYIVNLQPKNFAIISNETYQTLLTSSEQFRYLLNNNFIICSDYDNKINNIKKETITMTNDTTNSGTINNSTNAQESKNSTSSKKGRKTRTNRTLK